MSGKEAPEVGENGQHLVCGGRRWKICELRARDQ